MVTTYKKSNLDSIKVKKLSLYISKHFKPTYQMLHPRKRNKNIKQTKLNITHSSISSRSS